MRKITRGASPGLLLLGLVKSVQEMAGLGVRVDPMIALSTVSGLQTRLAPYFSDKRRVGSSPVRTIGASTHNGRLRGSSETIEGGGVLIVGLLVRVVLVAVGVGFRAAMVLDSFADTERREGVTELLIIASRCLTRLRCLVVLSSGKDGC